MLMTATPVTDSPMNLIELVNMIKDDVDVLPTSPVEFTKTFLSPKGTFTPTGKRAFKKWIGPNVSYLNHMFDARQFAQPIVKTILAPMTQRSIRVETIADIALKKKNIKESYTRGRTLNGKKMRILDLLKKSLDLQIVHNRFVVKDRARLNKQIAAAKTDKMRDELRVQLESPEYKLVDEKVILENKKKRLDNTRETRVALANLKISEKVELDKLKFERRVMESDTSQERMLRVDCGL
jgi:hypothetical protein